MRGRNEDQVLNFCRKVSVSVSDLCVRLNRRTHFAVFRAAFPPILGHYPPRHTFQQLAIKINQKDNSKITKEVKVKYREGGRAKESDEITTYQIR
jgi:hypothetical protein